MLQGPSVGPALLLNVLMRWPAAIIVCGLAGAGTLVYNKVDAPQYISSIRELTNQFGITKTAEVVEAAKNVEVIPAANAGIAHDGRGLSPLVETTMNPKITVDVAKELTPEELIALRKVQLQGMQVVPVRLGQ